MAELKSLVLPAMRPLVRRPLAATARQRFPEFALLFLPPLGISIFFWLTSPNDISLAQWIAAFVVSCLTWGSYRKWRAHKVGSVPLFAMVSFMFWLYYAFPLFWGDRLSVAASAAGESVSNQAITGAMIMAAVGTVSIWAGMRVGIGARCSPRIMPEIPTNHSRWSYLWIVMIVGTLIGFFEVPTNIVGEEFGQVIYVLLSIVPLVPFAILFRHYLQGKATTAHKVLIVMFLASYFLISMSSGWLGTLVYLMITCAAIFIAEKKRVPRLAVVLLVVYVLFFQVGKFSLREKYWSGQEEGGKIERIAFWVNESLNKWGEAFSDPSSGSVRAVAYESLSRVSLLTQTANVLEMTPSTIPYQYGRLYSYMAIALIPRFAWPNKPSANDANQFYQVSYGLTSEDDLSNSSFGAGLLAESYINFSWVGVVSMMFLFGVFLDFFQKTFLSAASGVLLGGIGVVLLPYLLSIEFHLAGYMGATFQRILSVLLILSPLIHFQKTNKQNQKVAA